VADMKSSLSASPIKAVNAAKINQASDAAARYPRVARYYNLFHDQQNATLVAQFDATSTSRPNSSMAVITQDRSQKSSQPTNSGASTACSPASKMLFRDINRRFAMRPISTTSTPRSDSPHLSLWSPTICLIALAKNKNPDRARHPQLLGGASATTPPSKTHQVGTRVHPPKTARLPAHPKNNSRNSRTKTSGTSTKPRRLPTVIAPKHTWT